MSDLAKGRRFPSLSYRETKKFDFSPIFISLPSFFPFSPPTHIQSPDPLTCITRCTTWAAVPYMRLSAQCRVFEVTRSSDHLAYFIKNTWDATQTGSLASSLYISLCRGLLASELRHFSSIKLPDGQKLPHLIHLHSEPISTFISLRD